MQPTNRYIYRHEARKPLIHEEQFNLAKQSKTLEYRRARFLDDGQNLEGLVRQAWGQFATQAERTITFSDDRSSCGLRARDCNGNGFAIHCGRYTDGQGVGTIPTVPAPEVEVGERPPGAASHAAWPLPIYMATWCSVLATLRRSGTRLAAVSTNSPA